MNDDAKQYEALCVALEALGERLRKWLEMYVNHSDQKSVAAKLGMSPQYLNDILRKRRHVTRAVAKRMPALLSAEVNCTGNDIPVVYVEDVKHESK
jgi:predicted transcriptional regulator